MKGRCQKKPVSGEKGRPLVLPDDKTLPISVLQS
jgi:hypothetical protein